MNSISRRQIVKGMVAAPFVIAFIPVLAKNSVFRHGVASGDPDSNSVVLWTRVSTNEPRATVSWEVANTSDFKEVITSGTFVTNAYRDYTVKVLATGLTPGQSYFYRFKAEGAVSVSRQTKTLPKGRVDRLGIALVSCSNYAFGFFNGYAAIAQNDDIDVVLHTGDYIYEFGDLATLVTLESRHTARAEQIGYHDAVGTIASLEDAKVFEAAGIDLPGRRMLSDEMESFLQGALQSSKEKGKPWRMLGNAIPMAKVRTPDRMLEAHNSEVRWTDNLHQGYVLVTLGAEEAIVDYIAVSSILNEQFTIETIRREIVTADGGSLKYS